MSLLNFTKKALVAARFTGSLRCTYSTRSIFVGNLPWSTTEDELASHFKQKVNVYRCKIPKDDMDRGRGYGFVEVEDGDYQIAVKEFNETDFNGRRIYLNEATNKSNY